MAVIFGGRSGEHEVSLLSARAVLNALDRERFDVVSIGITLDGQWLIGDDPQAVIEALAGHATSSARATPADPARVVAGALVSPSEPPGDVLRRADVAFPVLHGPYGEDGTIQGLFEILGLPYVGCGVTASAVAMDKAISKALFRAAGLPVVPHLVVLRNAWHTAPEQTLDRIEHHLPYPLFVKPANLGSSVGVSKARVRPELAAALDVAAQFDRKLIVERAVEHARELEVAVLGNDEPRASLPGEVRPRGHEFYSYEAKYTEGGSDLLIPAPVSEAVRHTLRHMAITAFRAIDGSGMARVDFFMDGATGDVYVNEVNTIPGFTPFSMYPKLWEAEGMSYRELVEALIQLALERAADVARNRVGR
ncbi:MAG: D-alanine--D-alanine ligase family protein [Ardenticatenia bacterium]|nr:D-alanine--D-alanine ligase family protein [Ardenticatenia bacterium]